MGVIGLDYAEVRQSCREAGIEYTNSFKRRIRLLEGIVLGGIKSKSGDKGRNNR